MFRLILTILSIILFLIIYFNVTKESTLITKSITADLATISKKPISFEEQIKPILDRRCVVCHGCYDAPCQLKLSSIEGLMRGASKERIYEVNRITTMEPTRLFIDAKNTKEWRERDFFSVLNEGEKTPQENLKNSLLYHLLTLKQEYPQVTNGLLSDVFTLELDRKETCPTLKTIDEYIEKKPKWGMPYAMPNLLKSEHQTLISWIAQGSPTLKPKNLSTTLLSQIKKWEEFLNGASNKQKLVSRYLYEHLFHAHIHFKNSPTREFYRLVRSSTSFGKIIDEIATRRPYEDPLLKPFYYRLKRYTSTIVTKSHIVYEFSPQKMRRYRELFLTPDYEVSKLPSYDKKIASNPFKVFAPIPEESRYRFLLDDARFFIEGFIKGPVCRGQIALNAIEDQFWVLFFDPKQPIITNSADFIDKMADELQIPTEGNNFDLVRIWTNYWKGQRQYMEHKQSWFNSMDKHDLSSALNFIWDGDGNNPNASLSVFRHFDSGSVAYGLLGSNPETTWIIDYPLFERIHYLLVAGFDVYGNLGHRLSIRVYMDFLRMEGENYFLAFLPASKRKEIRNSWYVGQRENIDKLFSAPKKWLNTEMVTGYKSDNPQLELYELIKKRVQNSTKHADNINQCGNINCQKSPSKVDMEYANSIMKKIAKLKGKNLHSFPDVAFVRVTTDKKENDFAYTLIRNKAYKNVTSFLSDELERDLSDIEKDTMSVVNWLEGSYPNFFFLVPFAELEEFVELCTSIHNYSDYEKFVDRYGVRRTNAKFWKLADWFVEEQMRNRPISSGLFDLNRYQNR